MALPQYLDLERYIGTLDLDGSLELREQAGDPATPPLTRLDLYAKDKSGVSTLFYRDDAGTVHDLSSSALSGGTTNRLAYWTSATTLGANAALTTGRIPFADANGLPTDDAALVWDNTNKRVGLGAASPASQLELSGTATDLTRGLRITQTNAAATAAAIFLAKSRTGGALNSGDTIGNYAYIGHNGTAFSQQAGVRCVTTEAWTTSAMGNKITFSTTNTGATTETERFEVGPAGQWGIGGANYGTSGHALLSGGASAAPTWDSAGISTTITTAGLVGKTITVTNGLITGFA